MTDEAIVEVGMARVNERPRLPLAASYDTDFHAWAFEQADLLRHGRSSAADIQNIAEELETFGRSEWNAMISSYRLILQHLLKWAYQPSCRSSSWIKTINRERRHLAKQNKASPSLSAKADFLLAEAYDDARPDAADETDLPLDTFPAVCPWTIDQVRDPDFLPD